MIAIQSCVIPFHAQDDIQSKLNGQVRKEIPISNLSHLPPLQLFVVRTATWYL